jgi:hypothetical protein
MVSNNGPSSLPTGPDDPNLKPPGWMPESNMEPKHYQQRRDAESIMASMGIGSSIFNIVPTLYSSTATGYIPSIKGLSTGWVNISTRDPDGFNSAPKSFIHEHIHAFEDSLSPEEIVQIQELKKQNPIPYGPASTYHNGIPQSLTGYFDQSGQYGDTISPQGVRPANNGWNPTPSTELFRSDITQSWKTVPEPILNFIRQRHPLDISGIIPSKNTYSADLTN